MSLLGDELIRDGAIAIERVKELESRIAALRGAVAAALLDEQARLRPEHGVVRAIKILDDALRADDEAARG